MKNTVLIVAYLLNPNPTFGLRAQDLCRPAPPPSATNRTRGNSLKERGVGTFLELNRSKVAVRLRPHPKGNL